MNYLQPTPPPSETELRARLAAGSREATDYLLLATTLRYSSRFLEAADILNQALRLDVSAAERARLSWELGDLLDKVMNRSAEAVVLARTAIEGLRQAPETPETRLLLGRSYALLAHSIWARDAEAGTSAAEHAVDLLEQVIERHGDLPDLGVALSDVAWAYTALGDPQRAVSVCEEYLRRETAAEHRLVALMLLAEALRLVGRLTEASDVATQALVYSEFDPLTRPVLHNTLGLIERAAGRRHEARQSFEAALGVLRHDPFRAGSSELLGTIYGNLAELYYETGNFDGAIAMFRELLGQYREDSAFYWRVVTCLADCHAAKGSYEEARRYYREVLMAEAAEDEQRASAGEGLAALPAP